MRGYPQFNFPAFNAAAVKLRNEGHEVFNPAERDLERSGGVDITNATGCEEQLKREHGVTIRECLHDDLVWICEHAEAIALLPGWEKSTGARAEHATAVALGLKFIYLGDV